MRPRIQLGVLLAVAAMLLGDAAIAAVSPEVHAAKVTEQESIAIAQVLDARGQLALPDGFAGAIDPGGFAMVSKAGEAPRFVPKSTMAADGSEHWADGFGNPGGGCDGPVRAIARALDGSLYLGGSFTDCDGVAANRVVRWDPATGRYTALGSGTGGANSDVYAIAVSGGDVYVGGLFTQAGGAAANRVARWNGSAWSSLGGGTANGVNGAVLAIAISGSEVFVGGQLTQAGGAAANYIARWNGSAWSSLGIGTADGVNNSVSAIAVSGSDVYVGGSFTLAGGATANRVARWNGSGWSSLGSDAANGVNDLVRGIAVSGSDVYVGGRFTQAGGAAANNVARWNGSAWASLGSGLANGVNAFVDAIAVSGSDLYVGGFFNEAGGAAAKFVARWNGSSWSALGTGTANGVGCPSFCNVFAIAVSGSDVYVGGSFTQAGGTAANVVARWNGSAWSSLGSGTPNGVNGSVHAIAVSGSDVYVGGGFTQAGGAAANNVARWNGSAWSSLGGGTTNGVNNSVYAIAVSGSDVYVAGAFSEAGGAAANNVARWNGSAWSSLGIGSANGVNSIVFAIAVSGSAVFVGGQFTQAGGAAANYVARWNGSAWSTLGGGTTNGVSSTVRAITVSGSDVYVGGGFGQAGGAEANRVARWNGSAWFSLGSGTANGVSCSLICDVLAIAVSGSDVYVGGGFIQAGGAAANKVARWNGSAWSSLGSGMDGFNSRVAAIAVLGSDVYAGGFFTQAGGAAAKSVARWNGSAWSSLGSGTADGVNSSVNAIAVLGSDVYMGGDFTRAGDKPASRFSRYDARRDTAVSLASSVNPSTANGSVTFTASVATVSFPTQTGSVAFRDGASTIIGCGAVAMVGGLDTRTATCTTNALPVGSRSITAQYSGDALNFSNTSEPLIQVVNVQTTGSLVSVGTRSGVPGQTVAVPISFRGDGVAFSFSAQVQFDSARLDFLAARASPGATCTRILGDRIQVSAPSSPGTTPLSPSVDTRFCDLELRIRNDAVGGAAAVSVVNSLCTDDANNGSPCTTSNGAVGISSVQTSIPTGTLIAISGYQGTAEATRTVRITNRGTTALQLSNCTVSGHASLSLRTPANVSIPPPPGSHDLLVGCVLPAVGTVLAGELICSTSDPIRTSLRYGLSCSTVPAGQPLPGDQIFDDELKQGDQLGTSAALSKSGGSTDVMVLGAPFAGGDSNGRVFIMEGQPASSVTASLVAKRFIPAASPMLRIATLAPPSSAKSAKAVGDKFGQSAAMSPSGNRIAVGASLGGTAGQVFVYDRPATGWQDVNLDAPVATINAPASGGGVAPSEFGDAVAFMPNGDLVVGAPGSSTSVAGVGAVYVYATQGTGFGPSPQQLLPTTPSTQGRFGDALDVSANMIVVGAPQEGSGAVASRPGAGYLFPVTDGIVDPGQRFVPAQNAIGDKFGSSVAIADNGMVIVGAENDDTVAGVDSGSAVIFRRDGATIAETTTLLPDAGTAAQGAGAAVATNGDLILLGAPLAADASGQPRRGRVYAYELEANLAAVETAIGVLENAGGAADDRFGRALAINQRQALAGVPLDDRQIDAVIAEDVGRGDPFVLDRVFRGGFE